MSKTGTSSSDAKKMLSDKLSYCENIVLNKISFLKDIREFENLTQKERNLKKKLDKVRNIHKLISELKSKMNNIKQEIVSTKNNLTENTFLEATNYLKERNDSYILKINGISSTTNKLNENRIKSLIVSNKASIRRFIDDINTLKKHLFFLTDDEDLNNFGLNDSMDGKSVIEQIASESRINCPVEDYSYKHVYLALKDSVLQLKKDNLLFKKLFFDRYQDHIYDLDRVLISLSDSNNYEQTLSGLNRIKNMTNELKRSGGCKCSYLDNCVQVIENSRKRLNDFAKGAYIYGDVDMNIFNKIENNVQIMKDYMCSLERSNENHKIDHFSCVENKALSNVEYQIESNTDIRNLVEQLPKLDIPYVQSRSKDDDNSSTADGNLSHDDTLTEFNKMVEEISTKQSKCFEIFSSIFDSVEDIETQHEEDIFNDSNKNDENFSPMLSRPETNIHIKDLLLAKVKFDNIDISELEIEKEIVSIITDSDVASSFNERVLHVKEQIMKSMDPKTSFLVNEDSLKQRTLSKMKHENILATKNLDSLRSNITKLDDEKRSITQIKEELNRAFDALDKYKVVFYSKQKRSSTSQSNSKKSSGGRKNYSDYNKRSKSSNKRFSRDSRRGRY